MNKYEHIRGVVLDWAGTTIDHGSRAPAIVFQQVFRGRGVEVTVPQAREPMGMAKLEHIAAIAAIPEVSEAWSKKYGRPCQASDVEGMYADFLPLQLQILDQYCDMIEGVANAVDLLRERGLKIGSSTGYTRKLMEVVTEAAARQGYSPDCVLCAEDAPRGRPAPYLLYKAATLLDIYPMSSIVKVDDTAVGIQAGRNAGCWTVGVTRTGNCVGLSSEEIDGLSEVEVASKCADAETVLRNAGAHAIVESVADLPAVIDEFEGKLAANLRPS